MALDPEAADEFREIRGILRETVSAINQNSNHISDLTGKMGEMITGQNTGRVAAVSEVKSYIQEVMAATNTKLIWFLVGAVVLSALGQKALELLAGIFGIG